MSRNVTDSCTICVRKKQERCAILIPSKTEYSQGRADGYGFFIARMIGGETPMLISVVVPYYLSQGYNRNTKRDAKHSASHFAFGEIYEKG